MTPSFIMLVAFFPFTTSTEVVIERAKDFDRIIWDGDSIKINGASFMSGEEKICACKKRMKVQNIKTNLFGALYPDGNGFVVTCSYNYRESGKYEIQIDRTLSSQNDRIQKIVRIANIIS